MKIALTGSTGFVGSAVIDYFGTEKIVKLKRCDELNFHSAPVVIHLAGLSQDSKKNIPNYEYYQINTEITKRIFDAFLDSDSKTFITLSSVKAVKDQLDGELSEEHIPNPTTGYGKSKLLAEEYIFSKKLPNDKKVYVLRPCIIHGAGNKGNLNLLYKIVSFNFPWPLGAFKNKRSFCSIENLLFIINELIERNDISSGIYNVADDEPISTNDLIMLIAKAQNKKYKIWKLPKIFIKLFAKIGDKFNLPFNSDSLQKLTSSYVVSNKKIILSIGKPLPISSKDGLLKTFKSFNLW